MAQAITTYNDFQGELERRGDQLATMMPEEMSEERRRKLIAVTAAAVRQNPVLLKCTPRSLFGAIERAAQDGLMPDAREGVINVYKTKQRDGSWQETAQWIPMTHGLRKRAEELAGIMVDAQVVREGDSFAYWQGDNPRIEHAPAPLGTARGEMIGAYAIFKARDGTVLHREVMDAEQIERVRSQSKQPDGLMWTKFTEEAWRKTVIRRGFKSVPCSERLQAVVQRDDDLFDFGSAEPGPAKRAPLRVVQAAPGGERRPLPPMVGGGRPEPTFADPGHQAAFDMQKPADRFHGTDDDFTPEHDPDTGEIAGTALRGPDLDAWLDEIDDQMAGAGSRKALTGVWASSVKPRQADVAPADWPRVEAVYVRHEQRLGR